MSLGWGAGAGCAGAAAVSGAPVLLVLVLVLVLEGFEGFDGPFACGNKYGRPNASAATANMIQMRFLFMRDYRSGGGS